MPTVPITAEPIESLKARYHRALEFVYDQWQVVVDGSIRPSEVAAQVFDYEDGLRLVVSRERSPDNEELLHIIAGMDKGGSMFREIDRLLAHGLPLDESFAGWSAICEDRFRELSGDRREMTLACIRCGTPHWVIIPWSPP